MPHESFDRPRLRIAIARADAALRGKIEMLAEIGEMTLLDDWKWPPEDEKDAYLTARPDIVYYAFLSEMEESFSQVTRLASYAFEIEARLVISTDMDSLDDLFATDGIEQCQVVIGNEPSELLLAFNMAAARETMGTLFDRSRDDDARALDRISSELAEYARALSRMARAEADGSIAPDHLADKGVAYRGPPRTQASPFLPSEGSAEDTGLNASDIRNIIRLRRLRDRYFPSDLFADPGWDILLDLMAARLEGTRVSVSSLCIAAAVPATTALRWIKNMTDAGYLERRADPSDARRVYIRLSDQTAARMAEYLRQPLDLLAR